jgi:hypothetical protein
MRYKLKLIDSKNYAGFNKFDNCFTTLVVPISRTGKRKTNLTKDEEEEIEKELGFAPGFLNSESDFWKTFIIKISSKGEMIDDSYGMGKLTYYILRKHYQVATTLSDITPNTLCSLVNEESEAVEKNRKSKIRRDAVKEFDKLSASEMRRALRLYGVNTDQISNDLVETKLFDEVEKDPSLFFTKWVDNKNRDTEFLIEEALSNNILRKNRTTYFYGTDILGNGSDDVVAYLKQPKNSEIRATIQAELEAKKKIN